MAISDEKLKIVINNYFKSECDVNTSIREAFEKGFRIGVKKGLMQIGADRKTENCSEKPNNSTCSKMEQVETMSCAECKHRPIGAEICEEPCHYEPQTDWHYDEQDATWYPYKHEDEPQQKSCATCKHALGNWDGESNNCGRCCGADRRFYEPKDEPTISKMEQVDKDINVRSKDEPQRERSE